VTVPNTPLNIGFDSLAAANGSCYMIGIGGCGMSGLARLLHAHGVEIAGTDSTASPTTDALGEDGLCVAVGEAPSVLPANCGSVVASAAVPPSHPLMLEADKRGVPVFTYAEALGQMMRSMTGVALAGTHGKSTTTAMLSAALIEAGLDPTVIVGASCPHLRDSKGNATGFKLGSNLIPQGPLKGQPGMLLAEACEFNRSFHKLAPRIACIGSVEADHLDIYGSIDAVVHAFHEFAKLIPPASDRPGLGGKLIIGHDNAHRRDVTSGIDCEVETIGFNPAADWSISFDPESSRVKLKHKGKKAAEYTCPMPGDHSALNSAMAFALADSLGADRESIVRAFKAFKGIGRRLELIGDRPMPEGGTVRVYDDYGHHPTEVEMTLRALRQHERPQDKGGRLVCVFQPHQHSRTRFLLDDFAAAFGQADVVIVPNIYFVRDSEAEKHKVSAGDLVDRLRSRGTRAMHIYPFDAIVEQVEETCRAGDLLVVMGAGPVWTIARSFMERAPSPTTKAASHAVGAK